MLFNKKSVYKFMDTEVTEDVFDKIDIDIDCTDANLIARKIDEMAAKWSREQSTANDLYRQKAQSIYKPLLTDPVNRQEYQIYIKARRTDERNERYVKARKQVELLLKDPTATTEGKERVVALCSHKFGPTREEIAGWLQGQQTQGAPILPPLQGIQKLLFDSSVEPLPSHKMKPITEICDRLGKLNLYDYLGVELEDAENGPKIAAALKTREAEKDRMSNTGAEAALKPLHGQLIANVNDLLLGDPQKCRQYLRSIGDVRLEPMLSSLNARIVADKASNRPGSEKILAAGYVEALVGSVEEWVPKTVSMQILFQVASKAGYAVQMPALAVDEQVCRSCQKPNSKSQMVCSCGYVLRLKCPKCSKEFAVTDGRCSNCGLDVDTIADVQLRIEQVKHLIKSHALSTAQNILTALKLTLGSNHAAVGELEQQVAALSVPLKQSFDEAASAAGARKLVTAERLLASLLDKDNSFPNAQSLLQQVNRGLKDANDLLANARQLESSGRKEESAREYANILNICADHVEAIAALRRLPPAPSTSVSARLDQRRVTLNWNVSPSQGVTTYVVIRKAGGAPSAIGDGDEVARVGGTSLDDLKAPVGTPIFYTVFAGRGDVFSATGPTTAALVVTADVEKLAAKSDDGRISLTWTVPGQVQGIEVRRRLDRAPTASTDGDRVELSGNTMAIDSNAKNNQNYYYGVYCLYRGSDGKTVCSNGAFITARAESPPRPLTTFTLRLENKHVIANWERTVFGDVHIVRSAKRLSHTLGETLPKAHIDSLGVLMKPTSAGAAIDENPVGDVAYYTALTSNSQTAVIGSTQRFACISDAMATRLEKSGGTLQASWRWPASTNIARIGWRTDTYPVASDDPNASFARINIADYNSKGRFVMPVSCDQDCYFTVFVGVVTPEGDILASGLSDSARAFSSGSPQVLLSYTVKKSILSSKRQLLFTAPTSCALPGIAVIAKAGQLPVALTDGTKILTVPTVSLSAEQAARIDLPAGPKGHFIKVFFLNEQDYTRFQLKHPPKDTLAL